MHQAISPEPLASNSLQKSNRRSIRRINKLLQKNISQYKIPNPYRVSRCYPYLPPSLTKQLNKLDHLSIRSLQHIKIKQPSMFDEMNQILLMMKSAVKVQQGEFVKLVNILQEQKNKDIQKPKPINKVYYDRENAQIGDSCNSNKIKQIQLIKSQHQLIKSQHLQQGHIQISNQAEQEEIGQQMQGNMPMLRHHKSSILSDNYEQQIANYDYQLHKNFTLLPFTSTNNHNLHDGNSLAQQNQQHFYY